jgi:hypothetical protein
MQESTGVEPVVLARVGELLNLQVVLSSLLQVIVKVHRLNPMIIFMVLVL